MVSLTRAEPVGAAGGDGVRGVGRVHGVSRRRHRLSGVSHHLLGVAGVGGASALDVGHVQLRAQHEAYYHETHWSSTWFPVFVFMLLAGIAGIVQSTRGYSG